ncbi:hypothetical protein CTAYLR_003515 [Chrysophaeum taylorii]|uniref:RNA polymerase I associated factor, A49-like protein n=1 Tax=Chrysophaeum taylorii TaxID=2483200 RepID=A0AAD7XKZ2_9STRA|nr:hypothetical protein CTAYLR_003515 [Chrysophaeum taylorii]
MHKPKKKNPTVAVVAQRYKTSYPEPTEVSRQNIERLVDPTGVVAVAAAMTGTHVVGRRNDDKVLGVGRTTTNPPPVVGVEGGFVQEEQQHPRSRSMSAATSAMALPKLRHTPGQAPIRATVVVVVDEADEASSNERLVVEGSFSSLLNDATFESNTFETPYATYTLADAPQRSLRWAIGVFDPSKNEVVIRSCEAKALRVAAKKAKQNPERKEGFDEQLALAKFASRKKQKILKSRLANAVQEDQIADLTETIEGIEDKALTSGKVKASNAPARRVGKPIEEAYDWDNLFRLSDPALETQLRALRKFAKDQHKSTWIPEGWPDMLKTRLEVAPTPALLLLRHVIEFFSATPAKGTVRVDHFSREHQIPDKIVSRFFQEFTEQQNRTSGTTKGKITFARPTAMRNKLLMHLLLLALYVHDFDLDTAPLARALSLEPKHLAPHLREMGFTFSSKTCRATPKK